MTPDRGPEKLSTAEIETLVPARVADRRGWARDVEAAIIAAKVETTPEHVCAVLAVIEQESNYQTDPVVRNLPKIVREGMLQKLDRLGPLAGPALDVLLAGKAPGSTATFAERINRLRTERDLDRFFRSMASAYRDKFPGSFVIAGALLKLLGDKGLEELNPVTTAGSMQVKVDFARSLAEFKNLSDAETRELLFTRAGGVRAGTARLLGYPAAYSGVIYRFADYNSGIYSARNAAFQKLLTDLTGQQLALDGDLIAYDAQGDPTDSETESLKAMLAFAKTRAMWAWPVRRAARQEKSHEFEDTDIWEEVRAAWTKAHGAEPPYARMPDVALVSPKLSAKRTTAWFAASVDRRYQRCRKG